MKRYRDKVLWQWGFTLERAEPFHHLLIATLTTITSTSAGFKKSQRTCAATYSPFWLRSAINSLSSWHHRMVAGSHQLYAQQLSHRSGSWECTVTPLFSTPLVSHGMFSVLRDCPAAVSNWASLSALTRGLLAWLTHSIMSKPHSMFCNYLHRHSFTAASLLVHASKFGASSL